MNIVPLFADTFGVGEFLNRLDFTIACALASLAMILAIVPRKIKFLRWFSICFALASIWRVTFLVRGNTPQWQPA